MSWHEFLAMGGYGFFVWTSYGIAFVVLILNIIIPIVQRKQFFKREALKAKRQRS
jgi:heme exporter protein D